MNLWWKSLILRIFIRNSKIWFFSESCKSFSIRHMTAYRVWESILGIPRTHFWQNYIFPAESGRIIDCIIKIQKIQKITKIEIFMKKIDFFLMFKIDFRDRKWPENGLKGVLKWFKTQNWQLNQFSANFEKNEKIDFWKKKFMIPGRISIFRPNFGRKSAGNPFIPSYLLQKNGAQ